MARMARAAIPGYPHHVILRGNRKQRTFFCEEDYLCYIQLLAQYTVEAETDVWAYCLMPNHIHLVMVPGREGGLREAIAETHRRYARRINFREGWRGHLWHERFNSFVMDDHYLLSAVRYVERNPVTAGLCACPHQWRWSSAKAHMRGKDDGLVRVAPMLDRVDDWYGYVSDSAKYHQEIDLIEQHARTGRPLGHKAFVRKLEGIVGESLAPRNYGQKAIKKKQVYCPRK